MSRLSDPTRPDPAAKPTRTAAGNGAAPTETRGYQSTASEVSELPAIPGYDILGELGRGAIGIVYKARQVALNRTVAVKLVVGNASMDTLIRFRREAEAVAKLQHPNIVQIFEVGSCAAGSFLALEYVDGGTLREKVAGIPQPPREAARTVETLARAVHHAHDRLLVHRDLKPSNVLLTSGGVPKVADFGLARSLDGAGGALVTTNFVGTPAYAAPEQIVPQFGPVGPATDVYALGAILYELVTGRLPFDSEAVAQILHMVVADEPVPPHRLKRDCPRDLETICLKCLQKDPKKRYASAAELADDLRRFAAGEPIAARPIGPLERAVRWTRRNPVVAGLLGAVFTLLTVVAAVAVGAAVRIDDARKRADANASAATIAAAEEEEAKLRAERDRDAARKAEREGKAKLLRSLISEAKASRYSRRVGQRFGTLDAVRKATVLARELGEPAETFDELRNLAVAAFALPDLKPDSAWVGMPTDLDNAWHRPVPDPTYRWVAIPHQRGAVSLRRIGSGPDDCGEVARLPALGSEVRLRWSTDGRFLVAYHWLDGFQRIQVWRIGDEPPALVFEIPKNCIGCVLTPDDRHLLTFEQEPSKTGGPPALVGRSYELRSGKALHAIPLPAETLDEFAAHHPQRSVLAVCLAKRVAFIDLSSGKEIGSMPVAGQYRLAWHPHGELLACISGNHIDMWDTTRTRRVARMEHAGDGLRAHFNATGDVMVTVGWTNRLRLWNPYTGQRLLDTIARGTFGPDDRLCIPFPHAHPAAAGPQTVVEAGREYRTLPVGTGQTGVFGFTACDLHPGGRLVAVATYPGVALIDLFTGSERAFIKTQSSCRNVLFEPDGSLLIKTSAGLQRWPVSFRAPEAQLRIGPPEPVPVQGQGEGVARSADGKMLAVAALGGGAAVWHRDRPADALRVPQTDCRHVALSPDGKLFATGSWHGRGIKVWEIATGRLVRTLLPESSATIPAFSPDGKWLADWHGARWRVADWSEGPKAPAEVAGCAFAPDSRIVAWAKKGFVVLLDAETGRELAQLEDPNQDGLNALAFNSDGTLLFGPTSDGFCVRVWDLRKIRAGLVELGLDWDMPSYPPAPAAPSAAVPLQVTLVGENLLSDPAARRRLQRDQALLDLWIDPFDAEARLALGDWLQTANLVKDANAQYNVALALRPDVPGGHRLRARARLQLGDWSGCAADCTEALKKGPDALASWYRGLALTRLGRHVDALSDLTTAVESYWQSADVYWERAEVYRALGRTDAAAADWKRAAELARPTNTATHLNNIAWPLLLGPAAVRDPKRGLELAVMANNKSAGNPVFVNTLGLARYRNGMLKEAIADLERSMKLDRGRYDGYNLFPLAMCHAKLGARGAANDCFQRAVKWTAEQPKFLPTAVEELRELRIEAEGVLRASGVTPEPAPRPHEK